MSDARVSVYSALKLLPAAVALLEVEDDPVARRAVEIIGADVEGMMPASCVGDEVRINWDLLLDRRRSSTKRRLAELARSMLDGTPVDLRLLNYFEQTSWRLVMRALALSCPGLPPSIDDLLDRGATVDEIQRRRSGAERGLRRE